jgi:putative membrane protein
MALPFDGAFWLAELFAVALAVVFWGGVIVLIVLGIRWFLRQERGAGQGPGPSQAGPPAEDPLEILRRRYAAGEIDDEEYQRRQKTLRG